MDKHSLKFFTIEEITFIRNICPDECYFLQNHEIDSILASYKSALIGTASTPYYNYPANTPYASDVLRKYLRDVKDIQIRNRIELRDAKRKHKRRI